jgi:hypothetical protein
MYSTNNRRRAVPDTNPPSYILFSSSIRSSNDIRVYIVNIHKANKKKKKKKSDKKEMHKKGGRERFLES